MSEHLKRTPFIPAWLDDAELPQAEFRILCHLSRRAGNQSGIAYPSIESMATVCGMSDRTVKRCLQSLVGMKLIESAGKPFGGSTRYRLLSPIVTPETRLESPNSDTGNPIEAAPIVTPERDNLGRGVPSIVTPEPKEGSPMKVPQERFPNNTNAPEDVSPKLASKSKKPSPDTEMAAAIYGAYPRKKARPQAIKAIVKAMATNPGDWLLAKVQEYASAITWQEPRYIPYPATWFNSESYNDDPREWQQPSGNSGNGFPAKPTPAVNTGHRTAREETIIPFTKKA